MLNVYNLTKGFTISEFRQLGRVVMAQVSGFIPTCSKERGFESLSCQARKIDFFYC